MDEAIRSLNDLGVGWMKPSDLSSVKLALGNDLGVGWMKPLDEMTWV